MATLVKGDTVRMALETPARAWPVAFAKHICEGGVQDAIVNYCWHSKRLIIRPFRDAKLYVLFRWPMVIEWQTRSVVAVDETMMTALREIVDRLSAVEAAVKDEAA